MATQVAVVNTPATSKINWAAGFAFVVGLLSMFGLDISQETQDLIMKVIVVVLPPVIVILRSFFTNKSPSVG